MVNIVYNRDSRVFFGNRLFHCFAHPFGPPFRCHFGGPGRHYTPSGVLLASFGAPLGALLGPCWSHWAFVGRPLGLSKGLWVGLVRTL